VPRESTILPTSASTTISAPASLVWSVLLDTSQYPNWNSFCPRVTIHSQPPNVDKTDPNLRLNTSLTFHVVMDNAKPGKVTDTQLRVTDISTPEAPSGYIPQDVLDGEEAYSSDLGKIYRIAWTTEGSFVARGLKTERFHEIIPLGDGRECEVRTWECQGGILARAVKFYFKDVLKRKFAEWCEDLKRESERSLGEDGVKG
jgi:Polyketide cyclase / dehydrase and lipid transport